MRCFRVEGGVPTQSMGLLRQSPPDLNGPALYFRYAQRSSWASLGDQGELPIGAWATFLIARYPKLNANAAPQNWNLG